MRHPRPDSSALALVLAVCSAAPRHGPELRLTRDKGPGVGRPLRRRNARLDPSPQLAVDGAYGDATRAAVTLFQRTRGLSATGIADQATLRFFFSSRRRHTRCLSDWSSDVCSSD